MCEENIKAGNRMAGNNRLIHTPEGVKDSYNGECRKKLAVQDKILDTFYLYGYEHIQTPSFEYFDIFSKDRGSVGRGNCSSFLTGTTRRWCCVRI